MVITIGIVGTAKNTGKTTTLSVLLDECTKHDQSIGLTGIGYDGEAVDNLTFLPKPRLDVPLGTWVATSSLCLDATTAKVDDITSTGLNTSLGDLKIARIVRQGKIILAGPNNRESLNQVIGMLEEKGCQRIMVDGSLGRIIPLTAANGLVFATGAARNTDPKILAEEMTAISEIFSWQDFSPVETFPHSISIINKEGNSVKLTVNSILSMDDVNEIELIGPDNIRKIIIPGVIAEPMWEPFKILIMGLEIELLFYHPGVLMLHNNLPALVKILNQFRQGGGRIAFRHQLSIKAITLNPFYPKRQAGQRMYHEAYIDSRELKKVFEKCLNFPIFDVKHDSSESLFNSCFV